MHGFAVGRASKRTPPVAHSKCRRTYETKHLASGVLVVRGPDGRMWYIVLEISQQDMTSCCSLTPVVEADPIAFMKTLVVVSLTIGFEVVGMCLGNQELQQE